MSLPTSILSLSSIRIPLSLWLCLVYIMHKNLKIQATCKSTFKLGGQVNHENPRDITQLDMSICKVRERHISCVWKNKRVKERKNPIFAKVKLASMQLTKEILSLIFNPSSIPVTRRYVNLLWINKLKKKTNYLSITISEC